MVIVNFGICLQFRQPNERLRQHIEWMMAVAAGHMRSFITIYQFDVQSNDIYIRWPWPGRLEND